MKEIRIEHLKTGQSFSQDLLIDKEYLFLPAKMPLKEKDIKRLEKMKVDRVFTNGSLIGVSKKDKKSQNIETEPEIRANLFNVQNDTESYKTYIEAIKRVEAIFTKIQKKDDITRENIDSVASMMLQAVRENSDELVLSIFSGKTARRSYARSAVDCSVFSILIGINSGIPDHKIYQLAIGALLHDVGMLRIPEVVRNKEGKLTNKEQELLRQHTRTTYKIITSELQYQNDIGLCALQHHERWDGEGYPKKISGDEVDIKARIIAVADSFEAMISERPYRSPMIGYVAIKQILSDNSRRFDPEILKVFIKAIGIYPIGSIVMLNNSAIGKVIQTNKNAPLRPKVRIILDEQGVEFKKNDGPVIDLMKERNAFIAKAINTSKYTKQ